MYASHNSLTAYPVKRWYMKLLQPFSRCQEKGIDEHFISLYTDVINKISRGYSSNERTIIKQIGDEAFNKTIKTLILDEKERNMRNRSY